MAQIYGELIRAQLQSATNLTIGADATGLIYFHTGDKKLTVYDGTDWQKLVTEVALTSSLSGKVDANAAITGATKTKITFDSKGLVTSGADLEIGDIPTITAEKGGLGQDASAFTGVLKASTGTFSAAELVDADVSATAAIAQSKIENLTTDLSAKVSANAGITAATKTKITYDAKGLVTAGADIESNDLPSELFLKTISSTTTMGGALTLPAGDESEKIGLLTQGMIRYNTELATFEGCDGTEWGAIGGGGSAGGTVVTVTQVAHGLSVGNAVYLNGSVYTKAIATSAAAAEVVGVVSKADLLDEFDLTLSGELTGLTDLTTGEVYFLSAATAGLLTVDEPTVVGQVSVPVGVASSTTSLYVAPKRGSVVGSSNVRTQIALANNATTTVQNIAAYDAGELTGWVSITATTPLRFYVAAQFSKNGAANNYNVSYQVSGDTPPASFSVTATSGGLLQVTLPSVTGFASASINFALNAPAIGTSFPLTVSARNVVGDTSGTAVPAGYVGQVVSGASDGTTTAAGSNTDKVVTTLSLSPGNWLIVGSVYFDPSGTTTIRLQSSISTGSLSGAGTILNILGLDYVEGAFGLSSGYVVANYNFPANISSQTTFNVNARITYTGTPSVGSPLRACIRAIRIA